MCTIFIYIFIWGDEINSEETIYGEINRKVHRSYKCCQVTKYMVLPPTEKFITYTVNWSQHLTLKNRPYNEKQTK